MPRSIPPGGRSAKSDLTPTQCLSSRYELLGRLGSGGMAEIYLARAVGLEDFEKIVVLKRVLPDRVADRKYAAMFRDEARVAATLEHPNIVHTHDIALTDEECFFTMEYLHGEDLKAILRTAAKKGEQLPLELALQIAVGCAAGLHHAHEQTAYAGEPLNIVHRDVSPANIIVTRQSVVKLIDFGIAKAASDKEHTGVGVLKGKVAYMSPEQCRGLPLDRRSDIFALGIVLYEMITMKRPFQADNVLGTVHKVLGEHPVPPRQFRPECPEALERIVLKALHKDVEQRYQTVFEMQEELELVTRDCQLLALPGGLGRYLEHLFGPKPHPWTERARKPPAVPRWAWDDLDSTLTAPREGQVHRKAPLPPPIPRPNPQAVPSQNYTVVDTPPPGAGVMVPRPLTTTAPTPAAVAAVAAVPTQAPRPMESQQAAAVSDPSQWAMTPPPPVRTSDGWGLKHVLLGGLVGGALAGLGLWIWMKLTEPEPSAAASPAVMSSESSPAPEGPEPSPAVVAAAQDDPGLGSDTQEPTPQPGEPATTGAEPTPDPAAPEASPASEPGAASRATELIERARANLFRAPKLAHRDAKAAYELKPTQTALLLMGHASCRMRNKVKARYAHRRLRGKSRQQLEGACVHLGIDLEK